MKEENLNNNNNENNNTQLQSKLKKLQKFKPDFHNLEMNLLDQILEYTGLQFFHFKILIAQIIANIFYGIHVNVLQTVILQYKKNYEISEKNGTILLNAFIIGASIGNFTINLQYLFFTKNRISLLKLNFFFAVFWFFVFILTGEVYWLSFICRIFIGFHIGFFFPVQNNLFLEAFPYNKKVVVYLLIMSTISFGQFFILLVELWIMPRLKITRVFFYFLFIGVVNLIMFVLYCLCISDSPKNFIGNECVFDYGKDDDIDNGNKKEVGVIKGVGYLRKEIVKGNESFERGFLYDIVKVVQFELIYPFLSYDLKEKNVLDNDINKENELQEINEENEHANKEEENALIKKHNNTDNTKENNKITNFYEKQLKNYLDSNNTSSNNIINQNNKNKNKNNSKHILSTLENSLASTELHMFDANYLLITLCNMILLIEINVISNCIGLVQDQIAANASKEGTTVKNYNPKNEILSQMFLNCFAMFTPIIAAVLVEYIKLGIRISFFIANGINFSMFFLAIFNNYNAVVYVGIGNGFTVFMEALIRCLVYKTYDIRISDKSVGVLEFIQNFCSLAAGIGLSYAGDNIEICCYVLFLVLILVGFVFIGIYPKSRIEKNRLDVLK